MSRLIDADSLRQDILTLPNCYNGFSDTYDKACIIGVIDEQPTIDAVHVIRCKDCKYKNLSDICEYFEVNAGDYTLWHHVEDNDFCSKAERRSDED